MVLTKLFWHSLQKRALVYPNGDSPEHAMMVWGESLTELLENATLKLGLWKNARTFYTEDGKKVRHSYAPC